MKQEIQNKLRRSILAFCAMMAMSVMTTAFSSCSSSDDDDEKVNIEEYLAGREWKINSTTGTYSYYKNHMVLYEGSPVFAPGGVGGEPNIGFGYWQMTGDKLTTQFVLGRPANFDVSNLLNGTLSLWDFTTTYTTKNGKATINGYITEGNVVSLYYINSDGLDVKFYNEKNGYMAAIWRKNRNAI